MGTSANDGQLQDGQSRVQTEARNGASELLSQLPKWLQPGVSPGVHIILRTVLVLLNALLLYCAWYRVMHPHFIVMFFLSLGLTICYFIFTYQIENISKEARALSDMECSTTTLDQPAEGSKVANETDSEDAILTAEKKDN